MDSYGYGSSEEHQPVMWLKGYPLYAAHMIVVVFVISLLATVLLMATGFGGILRALIFDSSQVLNGQVWRIATYGLVNQPNSLWWIVDMLMIAWFGRELEKFFGRSVFLRFYVALYLLSPIVLTILGLWRPNQLAGQTGGFALFIAFATLYPNVALLFNLLAKWVAIVLVAFYTLMAVAGRDWVQLLSLWATAGFAFAFVRQRQGIFSLPRLRWPSRKPKLRVLPDLPAKKSETRRDSISQASMAEVDALLDKIAKSGISSLTAQERAKLDAARESLKRRATERS